MYVLLIRCNWFWRAILAVVSIKQLSDIYTSDRKWSVSLDQMQHCIERRSTMFLSRTNYCRKCQRIHHKDRQTLGQVVDSDKSLSARVHDVARLRLRWTWRVTLVCRTRHQLQQHRLRARRKHHYGWGNIKVSSLHLESYWIGRTALNCTIRPLVKEQQTTASDLHSCNK